MERTGWRGWDRKGRGLCISRSLRGKITIAVTTSKQIPFCHFGRAIAPQRKKHWQEVSEKERKDRNNEKSSFQEYGRKHFSLEQEAAVPRPSPALLPLSSVADKLLATGKGLDWEAESRCVMNWGDLADVWPFPGPLRTDGLSSFTALVIYPATALSSFPHMAVGPHPPPSELMGANPPRGRRQSCSCIVIGIALWIPQAQRETRKHRQIWVLNSARFTDDLHGTGLRLGEKRRKKAEYKLRKKQKTQTNILFHAPSTFLTRRQTFEFLSAQKFFAGSDSSASSLCFQGDASASQQMNCSTVIASPIDWHSCLDIKICSFETSRHEDDLTCSVRRDCLGENPRKHTKAKHHIFPWNNNLMKSIKQQNRIHTGVPRSLADIWRRYAQMFFIFLPPNKNNPFSSFLPLRLVQNWFESPEKPSSPPDPGSRVQAVMEQTPTEVVSLLLQTAEQMQSSSIPWSNI